MCPSSCALSPSCCWLPPLATLFPASRILLLLSATTYRHANLPMTFFSIAISVLRRTGLSSTCGCGHRATGASAVPSRRRPREILTQVAKIRSSSGADMAEGACSGRTRTVPSRRVRQDLYRMDGPFVAAFREAAEQLKAGHQSARFPEGSFPPGLPFVKAGLVLSS